MAAENFQYCLEQVLKHEGGYANYEWDNGGATNMGITQVTYDSYRENKNLSRQDVRSITTDERDEIYKEQYWDLVGGDKLPKGVDLCIFDYAVNSGPAKAIKDIQRVVGSGVDGIFGPKTLSATRSHKDTRTIEEVCSRRLSFLKRLSDWKHAGKGWTRRVNRVETLSLEMIDGFDSSPVPKARPENISKVREALKNKGTWLSSGSITAGLGALSGVSGPLSWALAGVLVIAALVGVYILLKSRFWEDA